METLEQMYEELIKDTNRWSYYLCPPSLTYNTLYSEDESYRFIKNYFQSAGKGVVLDDDYFIIKNEAVLKKRSPHIISTYLLGILIAESLKCDINTRDDNGINFKYLWFLACLYHDIGYVYENDTCLINKAPTLEDFIKLVDIQSKDNLFIKYHQKITLCKNYYTYIKDKLLHIDHGIAGGLLLYSKLVKNYYIAKEQNKAGDEFVYENLRFSKDLFKSYEKAAISIIRHNMWFATEKEDIDNYKKYHLEKLIATDENKIKKCDDAILFLLCLADTIEPLKQFSNANKEYILDNICLQIINKKIIIKNSCDRFECKNYFEKIKSLEKWMDVNVCVNYSENCVTIEII